LWLRPSPEASACAQILRSNYERVIEQAALLPIGQQRSGQFGAHSIVRSELAVGVPAIFVDGAMEQDEADTLFGKPASTIRRSPPSPIFRKLKPRSAWKPEFLEAF
jgi:hypothetical protein